MGRGIVRDSDPGAAEPPTDSDPKLVAEMIRKHAPYAGLGVFETGQLATWFHRKLTADGLNVATLRAGQEALTAIILPLLDVARAAYASC
jgi:hypothetical protein